jgi:hypothetical protein
MKTTDRRTIEQQARDAHHAALQALSPHVRTQLQRRTRLALSGHASAGAPRAARWGWFAAPALALLLAFALPWPGAQHEDAAPSVVLATQAARSVELAAPLEQDPDFYLWLASADAVAMAGDRP